MFVSYLSSKKKEKEKKMPYFGSEKSFGVISAINVEIIK